MKRLITPALLSSLLVVSVGCTPQDVSPSDRDESPNSTTQESPASSQVSPSSQSAPTQSLTTPPEQAEATSPPPIEDDGSQPDANNPTPPSPDGQPVPDNNGDFSGKTGHQRWLVTDSDPNGLNCRWSTAMPTEWYSPSATLPPLDIANWEVVRRFPAGTVLTANTTPAGFATMLDSDQNPWLKVSVGENDQICLVRANERFIHPIN